MSTTARARVITEPLGGSPLSLAVQTRGLPPALQPWTPVGVDEWRSHAERRRSATPAGWLDRIRAAIVPSGAAAQRLDRVASSRGVVVTTGQQAGLFGGPLYTLAKALTALEVADAIERETGVMAAPVFWAATDDADFLEASVASVSDTSGLHDLTQVDQPAAGTPMSAAALGEMTPLLEALRRACGSAPHSQFFELARQSYSQESTVGAAYVRMLRGLLEPLGIAVLDSSHVAVQTAARPILLEALASAKDIAEATAKRAAAVRELGFEPQVEDDRGLSLVFAIENGLKRRLTIAEAGQVAREGSTALLAPNVLLRPVVEREILPTVAYVAGPGELAYFTQSDAVAMALGRDRLVALPRWSGAIVEPLVERAMKRLGAGYEDWRDRPALERRLARAALPENVSRAWKRLNEQVSASVQELARAVQESSLLPPAVIEGVSRALAHRLSRTERRLLAAVKRRDDAMRKDLACASAALWPRDKRQERVLNFIPMLARGGESLLADVRSAAGDHARHLIGVRQKAPAGVR